MIGRNLNGTVFFLAYLVLLQVLPRFIGDVATAYVLLAIVVLTTAWQLRRADRRLIGVTVALACVIGAIVYASGRAILPSAALLGIIFANLLAQPVLTALRRSQH